MLYLSVKFHQICFSCFRVMAETKFVMDRQTHGAILICLLKFLLGHNKNMEKEGKVNFTFQVSKAEVLGQ